TPWKNLKWTEAVEKTKTGEIDIIPKITPTPDRENFLLFTRPYTTFPSVIVTRKDRFAGGLDDLHGLKTGVVQGLVIESNLKRDRPDLTLVTFPDIETALRGLSTGKCDAFIDNLGTVTYSIDKLGLANLKIAASTPYTHDLAMGVRKDWPLLVSALNKALTNMSDQEKSEIKNRWLAIQYQAGVDWRTIGPIVAALLVIIVIFLFWNRRLGRAVAERERAEQRLKNYALQLEAGSLIKSQLAEISSELQITTTFEELARKFMSRVVPLVKADYGAFFVLDREKNYLRHAGGYGYDDRDLSRRFALGEGLVGQCALNKTPVVISPPEDYIRIQSGFGRFAPKSIVLQPVMHTGQVIGVLELGILGSFEENERTLMDELLPIVAMNLEILDRNLRTQLLLEETQLQAKSLQAQQEQMKETEIWYRSLIESTPDGMLVVDESGAIILVNTMAEKMFGYETGELLGRSVEILVPTSQRVRHVLLRKDFLQTHNRREMANSFNLHGLRKDGLEFPVDIRLSRLPEFGSRGICVCAAIRDLTPRRPDQVAADNKSEFPADLSHQIRVNRE
ncbi:MAG: transporter substrate-binding domain-containing protein, partial [Deltaproteobacteria bacterium]|nr:transporter substrate-binding domain-containing protein [Deltaproteobacteria bacterium]